MSFRVQIRRNSDGEVREYRVAEFDWDEDSAFIWTDGNYRCDCNRHLFFERAGGHEPMDPCPCGEEAYSIPKVILPDGREEVIEP